MYNVVKDRAVELVQARAPLALYAHEPGIFENVQVTRRRRPAMTKAFCKVTRGQFAAAAREQRDDVTARAVGKRVKNVLFLVGRDGNRNGRPS